MRSESVLVMIFRKEKMRERIKRIRSRFPSRHALLDSKFGDRTEKRLGIALQGTDRA